MHAPATSSARRPILSLLALGLVAVGALAACDRHSAKEVPESYGHGSARQKSYIDHHTDSTGTKHYSDTQGTETEKTDDKAAGQPSASPAGTPGGHFF